MDKNLKEYRNSIYRKMLKIHLDDIEKCKKNDSYLDGLCIIARRISSDLSELNDLPELKKFKPLRCGVYWWSRNPYNTKRKEALEKAIIETN